MFRSEYFPILQELQNLTLEDLSNKQTETIETPAKTNEEEMPVMTGGQDEGGSENIDSTESPSRLLEMGLFEI